MYLDGLKKRHKQINKRSTKRSRKRSKKRSIKRSIKRSTKRKRSKSKSKCKTYLQDKIKINMREYKEGRYVSPKQAIAVSYSQILKKHPHCKRILRRK